MQVKCCSRCKKKLSVASFYRDKYKKSGYGSHCKECERNKEIKKKYGIDINVYNRMLKKQNGVCALCLNPERESRKKNLSIDHCHITGKVRKLLCAECNIFMGKIENRLDLVLKMIKYIDKHRA